MRAGRPQPRGAVPFGPAYYPTMSAEKAEPNFTERVASDFRTRDSCVGFIRKVYAVFLSQMVTTVCVTAMIMNNGNLQVFSGERGSRMQ